MARTFLFTMLSILSRAFWQYTYTNSFAFSHVNEKCSNSVILLIFCRSKIFWDKNNIKSYLALDIKLCFLFVLHYSFGQAIFWLYYSAVWPRCVTAHECISVAFNILREILPIFCGASCMANFAVIIAGTKLKSLEVYWIKYWKSCRFILKVWSFFSKN